MVVIVIVRRLRQASPKVVELCRRPVEFERETAELKMPRLLGQHDFQKVEVVRSRIEPLDDRGQKNRCAVARSDVVLRPANVLFDELSEIVQIDTALRQRMAIKPQHLADRPKLNGR